MSPTERARAVYAGWTKGCIIEPVFSADLEQRIAAAIETAVAAERARCAALCSVDPADPRLTRLYTPAEAAIAVRDERARCVTLARDWLPGDVLAELETPPEPPA